jgi:hypothetical protein
MLGAGDHTDSLTLTDMLDMNTGTRLGLPSQDDCPRRYAAASPAAWHHRPVSDRG